MSEPYCEIDADCEDGYECIGGRCVPIITAPPPGQLPGLGSFLRQRYTCNIAVVEDMSANDFLHDVIFASSRQYMVQAANGKIALRNKKPTPYAFATEALSVDENAIDVDNVSEWIQNVDNWLLINPHTTQSEIRRVTAAAYSTAQNSLALSSTGGLFTITGFSGCDGANTPATGTIEVTAHTADTDCTITVDTTVFSFRTSSSDTNESIASFIAGMIASHPQLFRRFAVQWAPGDEEVIITPQIGTLTLDDGLSYASDAPIADPVTAPTLSDSAGDLAAGTYSVTYAHVDATGNETLLAEYDTITLAADKQIDISAITLLPAGAVSVKWYCSPEANSTKLRFIAENSGAAFSINALPKLTAPLPPDLNRTGTEVMRVAAVFSDREETRSATSRSNVIRATFSWLLGNRSKSVNRVDLKYRDASQDWRLTELRLRDDAHIAKTKKVSKHEVNGQAIDNTDQAYRIGAGILAEKRDADFFYRWHATRAALLLQEGDVCAITDGGSGVVNFPVIIEEMEIDPGNAGLPTANFTARKYASTLYDDSIVERSIPITVESDGPGAEIG